MNNNNNYTWRKYWIRDMESPFSAFEKFKMANNMTKSELLKLVKCTDSKKIAGKYSQYGFGKWNLLTMDTFNEKKLELLFETPILHNNRRAIEIMTNNFQKKGLERIHLYHYNLRFCMKCISHGFHSVYHQFKLLDYCLLHGTKLITSCPKCNMNNKYEILNSTAFHCQCGHCFSMADSSQYFFAYWGKDNTFAINSNEIYQNNNTLDPTRLLYFDERELLDPTILINFIGKMLKTEDNYFKSITLNKISTNNRITIDSTDSYKEIYYQCFSTYKAISRYIRKHICKEHRNCIKRYVRNHPDSDQCSIALAYIYWRNHIEGLSDATNVDNHKQNKKLLFNDQLIFPIHLEVSNLEKVYRYCRIVWNDIDEDHTVVNVLLNNYFAIIIINLFQQYKKLFIDGLQSNKTFIFYTDNKLKPLIFYSINKSQKNFNIQLTSNIDNSIFEIDTDVICGN